MENFEFTYNVVYDTFTHEESGYMLSGDYLRSAGDEEIYVRICNATGVRVNKAVIDGLRVVCSP